MRGLLCEGVLASDWIERILSIFRGDTMLLRFAGVGDGDAVSCFAGGVFSDWLLPFAMKGELGGPSDRSASGSWYIFVDMCCLSGDVDVFIAVLDFAERGCAILRVLAYLGYSLSFVLFCCGFARVTWCL